MQISEAFRTRPPRGGKWIFVHPISGTTFSSPTIGAIKESIWRHEEANGYPISTIQDIEDRLCAKHPVACGEGIPNLLEKASNFISDMAQWAAQGFPVTTQEELQVRLDSCRGCPWFRGLAGNSLMHVMCGKCGCSNLKMSIATSHCPIGRW